MSGRSGYGTPTSPPTKLAPFADNGSATSAAAFCAPMYSPTTAVALQSILLATPFASYTTTILLTPCTSSAPTLLHRASLVPVFGPSGELTSYGPMYL